MSKELKPCPFCGEEAYIAYSGDNHHQPHVQCDTLHCPGNKTYQWHYKTEDEAIDAWNSRSENVAKQKTSHVDDAGFGLIGHCHECGTMILSSKYKYCPECGCKLDWS